MLGQMYREGRCGAKYLEEVARWYGKVAAQGNKDAKAALKRAAEKLKSSKGNGD
ncbi:MAG: hypothetical protein GY899_00115 [Verrucomicrobiaceae bacterium]|nr:hypothetical protein [Verrucomicrobiaceae bacterium]